MTSKSVPGQPTPDSSDDLVRRVEALERKLREGIASITDSFGPTIAELQETVAQLIATASFQDEAYGFELPSGDSASVLTGTIDIPAGYTRASVMVVGEVSAHNNSGAGGYLYGRVFVNDDDSGLHVSGSVPDGYHETLTMARSSYLTDLTPGGAITLNLYAKGDYAPWDSGSCAAYLSAVAVFLR